MGLSDLFLPERLPRQFIFAGDRHAEIVILQNKRIAARTRVEGTGLAEGSSRAWEEVVARLRPEETGVVFSAAPFIYNFFEFDRLPWKTKALRELVTWRLQKIFPEDIAAYDHRFFPLDKKRVLSILVRKSLVETVEKLFRDRRLPLTFIGNSTVEVLARLQAAKPAPDFFIESDRDGCTMVFHSRRSPIYIRKLKSGSAADTGEEIGHTVAFVRNNYGVAPHRYWLVDHQNETAAAALEATLAAADLSRLRAGLGETPHIPGSP
jgi:hypothetical protein